MKNDLLEFIDQSPTPYQGVEEIEKRLKAQGYLACPLDQDFQCEEGGKFYAKSPGAIFAFELGKKKPWETGFAIIGSHLDSPCLRVKPNPHIKKKNYIQINTEVYGGPLLYTWFDKPLTLAGKVYYQEEGQVKEKLVHSKKALTIIPSLAIHMNRGANEKFAPNPQVDLLPIFVDLEDKLQDPLFGFLEEELGIKSQELLDFDLFVLPLEKSSSIGLREELISAPRLDNLASAHASLQGLFQSKPGDKSKFLAFLNHEEIGSLTEEGASGNLSYEILERIVYALGGTKEEFYQALHKSFLLSADLAHAVHPSHLECADPSNQPLMGKGPVIKLAANRSYVSTGYTSAVIESLCRKHDIPYQKFVNASDRKGGSTLGPLMQHSLTIPGVDVGTPILAMHSNRELGAWVDQINYEKLFKVFLED